MRRFIILVVLCCFTGCTTPPAIQKWVEDTSMYTQSNSEFFDKSNDNGSKFFGESDDRGSKSFDESGDKESK